MAKRRAEPSDDTSNYSIRIDAAMVKPLQLLAIAKGTTAPALVNTLVQKALEDLPDALGDMGIKGFKIEPKK